MISQQKVNNYRQEATGKHQLFDINITNRGKMVFHVKQIISIILFLFLIIAVLTGRSHRQSNNFFSIYLLAAKDTTLNFAPFF